MAIISVMTDRKQALYVKNVKKKSCSVSGHVFFLDVFFLDKLDSALIWNRQLFTKIYTCTRHLKVTT